MKKPNILLLLLFWVSVLSAQETVEKTTLSFQLSGNVKTMEDIQYISHKFKIDGLKVRNYEASSLVSTETFKFDTNLFLTHHVRLNGDGKSELTEFYTFDSKHHLHTYKWLKPLERHRGEIRYNYNRLNRLMSTTELDDTGGVMLITAYRYHGKKVREIKTYNDHYVLWNWTQFEYDSLGNHIESKNLQSMLLFNRPYRKTMEYDENHQMTKMRFYDYKDSLRWEYVADYDKKSRLIYEATMDSLGNVVKEKSYFYKGDMLKKEKISDTTLTQDVSYYYDSGNRRIITRNIFGDVDFRTFYMNFDKYGNWTEKLEYDGLKLKITKRIFTYYGD